VACIGENETLAKAAQRMRDLDVGALPVCGDDGRLPASSSPTGTS
jgi:CBS domain-containing protein